MRASDWISCKDANPAESGEYLAITHSGAVLSLEYSAIHQAFNARDDAPDTPYALKPTHWMPIVFPKGGCGDD